MDSYRFLWSFSDSQIILMSFHVGRKSSVEFCGLLWTVPDFPDFLWSFMECYGVLGLLWTVLDFSRFLWSFMECYGVLGILVGFHRMQRMTVDGGTNG